MFVPRTFFLAAGMSLLAVAAAPLLLPAQRIHRSRPRQLDGIPAHNYQWQSRSRSVQSTARGLLLESDLAERARALLQARESARQLAAAARLADAADPENAGEAGAAVDVAASGAGVAFSAADANRPTTPQVDDLPPVRPGQQVANALQLRALQAMAGFKPDDKIRVFQLDRARLAVDHCMVSNVAVQLHRRGCWVLSLRADQNPLPVDGLVVPYEPQFYLKRNQFHIRMRCYGMYSGGVDLPPTLQPGRPLLVDLHPTQFWVERGEPRHVRITCCDHRLTRYFDQIDRMEIEFFYR